MKIYTVEPTRVVGGSENTPRLQLHQFVRRKTETPQVGVPVVMTNRPGEGFTPRFCFISVIAANESTAASARWSRTQVVLQMLARNAAGNREGVLTLSQTEQGQYAKQGGCWKLTPAPLPGPDQRRSSLAGVSAIEHADRQCEHLRRELLRL